MAGDKVITMHYKAPDNSLHVIEPEFAYMLPAGCIPITDEEAEAIRIASIPAPTQEQIIAAFTAAIQQRLDDFARTRNYDDIKSACTYALSGVAKFKAEGECCVNLRDATWSAVYQILEQALAGNWPTTGAGRIPTNIADIESDLPALEWPQ